MAHSAVAYAVVVALLAGCTAAPADHPTSVPLEPWLLDCEHASYQAGGACVDTTSDDGDRWGEPFVTVSPEGVWVIAVQGVAAPPDPATLPEIPGLVDAPSPECLDWGLCLFILDGTWRREEVLAPTGPRINVDPTLAWSGSSMLVAGLVPNYGGIGVLRSDDVGATFEHITTLHGSPKDDRPWIAAHGPDVVVVWQEAGAYRGFYARSTDAGDSWSEPVELPCNVFSTPIWNDGWRVACADAMGTRIYQLASDASLEAQFSSSGGTRMAAMLDGRMVVSMGSSADVHAAPDWEAVGGLKAEAARVWVGALAATDDRLVSIIWHADGDCIACAPDEARRYIVQMAPDGHRVATVALDPVSGRPMEPAPEGAVGEFDGAACSDVCLLAWMDDGAIAHAWLRPPAPA